MAKLMPGRVRNEGIELFEKDLITIHQVSEHRLQKHPDIVGSLQCRFAPFLILLVDDLLAHEANSVGYNS